MVSELGHEGEGGGLLAAANVCRGEENTGRLADERAGLPQRSGGVDDRLDLAGDHPEPRGEPLTKWSMMETRTHGRRGKGWKYMNTYIHEEYGVEQDLQRRVSGVYYNTVCTSVCYLLCDVGIHDPGWVL